MADSKQFGSPKVLQFGDKSAARQAGDPGHCAQCEAMLADALDGTLSAADQELFDAHMALCGPCSQSLADARRGAAWLEMLRSPAPEPPAELLERILAQTSGAVAVGHAVPDVGAAPGWQDQSIAAFGPDSGNVVPFRSRFAARWRANPFAQIMLQPRLAMTAAMAFFSIALTMDLTGIHPLSLRASDLSPGSLKRDFYAARVHVVQNYENLRVVYELESRVHDLQTANDSDAPAAGTTAQPSPDQTAPQAPEAQPGQAAPSAAPQPGSGQPEHKQPAPNNGTSRREELYRGRRMQVAGDGIYARAERKLA